MDEYTETESLCWMLEGAAAGTLMPLVGALRRLTVDPYLILVVDRRWIAGPGGAASCRTASTAAPIWGVAPRFGALWTPSIRVQPRKWDPVGPPG